MQPTYAEVVKDDSAVEHRQERDQKMKQKQSGEKDDGLTVLQRHVEFWDTDGDGVIWPVNTFIGFYKIGFGVILSFIAACLINGAFSYPTQTSWIPDPFFRIRVAKISRDKHGSDSGAYNNRGEFVEAKFERIFSEYSSLDDKSGLTIRDTLHFLNGQRSVFDFFGMAAVTLEWLATWILLRPKDGIIKKDDVLAVYDGSIFGKIARK